MFRNYLTIALRHLRKRRSYALINVVGLALGVASCLLILLYVAHERSYDRFHEDADRLYRVVWHSDNPQTRTPHPMAQALAADFPEVAHAVSLTPLWGPGLTRPTYAVRYEDRQYEEREVLVVDTTFFDVFSFPVLRGDGPAALRAPFRILLTASAARRYFGDEDPIGKTLRVNGDTDVEVGAVLADVPANAHFRFDFLLSYVTLKQTWGGGTFFEWEDFGHYNYLRLSDGADAARLETALVPWIERYLPLSPSHRADLHSGRIGFRLQPVADIHLHSKLRWELEPNGDVAYVYSLSAAALFLLLIACVNFTNLATARSADRAMEVGMRKTLGARRRQLVGQFLGESLLLSGLAVLLALGLLELALPTFNDLVGTDLYLPYLEHPEILAALAALVGVVGLLAGVYPAFYLASFRPATVLKGAFRTSRRGLLLRRSLVVFQFALSIGLIAGTLVIRDQVHYLRTRPMGFTAEQVVVVPLPDDDLRARYAAFKDEVRRHPNVLFAGAASNVPGDRFNQNPVRWLGAEETVDVSEWRVDPDVLETLGLTISEGRGFLQEEGAEERPSFLLNETAARRFGWDAAPGQELVWYADADTLRGTVLGVVKDFHFASLHQPVGPLLLQVSPRWFNYLLIRVRPEGLPETLAFLEERWQTFAPERAFQYSFLDQDIDALYRAEARVGTLIGVFSALAVLIACLGLFGLAAFTAEQRTKEVGVRKVFGATSPQIVVLLSKEFARLVLLAFAVTALPAYLLLQGWLAEFPYHVDVGAGTLVAAGALALAVAALTVSTQAFRAARANPIDSLRYE